MKNQAITTIILLCTTCIFNACGIINDASNSISLLLGCRNANKSGDNIAVTDVALNKNEASIRVADTEQLTATITPVNATNRKVIWSSSDENIATVDLNGVVTAVATGTAAITVTTIDGGFKAVCSVIVPVDVVLVTGVSLNKAKTTIKTGNTKQLTAAIIPANATNQKVIWSSSDENIATVDLNGVVTAVATGTATITITTIDGGFKAVCSVIVPVDVVPVTGVSLNKTKTTIKTGNTKQLTAAIIPANATNQKVIWSSSDENIATVDLNGVVTAVATGTAAITITTIDGGFKAVCSVIVPVDVVPVTGVSINKEETTIKVDTAEQIGGRSEKMVYTERLEATIIPENATNQNVTWSSSDENIATVDLNGVVTTVATGAATITVSTADGGYTASCEVTVMPSFMPKSSPHHIFRRK